MAPASEEEAQPGALSTQGHIVFALFDTGATHSFIACAWIDKMHMCVEPLNETIRVMSPFGGWVELDSVWRECPLILEGQEMFADLIVLPMHRFDVILGMDWLGRYGAKLLCAQKTIEFFIPEKGVMIFECQHSKEAFLSCLLYTVSENVEESVDACRQPVLVDFEDVYQEVPGLPPAREIEFGIDLLPDV